MYYYPRGKLRTLRIREIHNLVEVIQLLSDTGLKATLPSPHSEPNSVLYPVSLHIL